MDRIGFYHLLKKGIFLSNGFIIYGANINWLWIIKE